VIRYAFDLARTRKRNRLTMIDKANACGPTTSGPGPSRSRGRIPRHRTGPRLYRPACMWMVKNPDWFETWSCPTCSGHHHRPRRDDPGRAWARRRAPTSTRGRGHVRAHHARPQVRGKTWRPVAAVASVRSCSISSVRGGVARGRGGHRRRPAQQADPQPLRQLRPFHQRDRDLLAAEVRVDPEAGGWTAQ